MTYNVFGGTLNPTLLLEVDVHLFSPQFPLFFRQKNEKFDFWISIAGLGLQPANCAEEPADEWLI